MMTQFVSSRGRSSSCSSSRVVVVVLVVVVVVNGNSTPHWINEDKVKRIPIERIKSTHTHYNRAHTNQYIYDTASKLAYPEGNKRIQRFSDFRNDRKIDS